MWWIDPSPPQVCWWCCPHGWNRKGPPVDAQCTSLLMWILATPHQYLQSKICLLQIKINFQLRTCFEFKCGPSKIKIVLSWIWLDKHLDYHSCATALAESVSWEESLHGYEAKLLLLWLTVPVILCSQSRAGGDRHVMHMHLLWL